MADKTLLCTCVNCLKENPNGIQLNLNTYNRHRKRQQELSKKDEILEVIEQKENEKDKEDIENDDNNENNDDNDNKTNDEESNDENNSDVNEDDDVMQIDDDTNILNKEIIEGLKLLHLKTLYNFTESAYDNIMKIFTTNNTRLYKVKKYLKNVIVLIPVFYNMCENSCICYTGSYKLCQ